MPNDKAQMPNQAQSSNVKDRASNENHPHLSSPVQEEEIASAREIGPRNDRKVKETVPEFGGHDTNQVYHKSGIMCLEYRPGPHHSGIESSPLTVSEPQLHTPVGKDLIPERGLHDARER
jgi:hypothetical protein